MADGDPEVALWKLLGWSSVGRILGGSLGGESSCSVLGTSGGPLAKLAGRLGGVARALCTLVSGTCRCGMQPETYVSLKY